jgi:hypothetical protein
MPELPKGDISFLDGIPPVETRFGVSTSSVKALGLNSELNNIQGPVKRTLYFYFGLPTNNASRRDMSGRSSIQFISGNL